MRIITGKYGRRRFQVPTNITARPTTDFARENIFNVITGMVDLDDASALDLFAGTGAISFELASRGCSQVVAVEMAPTQCKFIAKVIGELRAGEISLVRGDVFKFLRTTGREFDFVFADPPYNLPDFDKVAPGVIESGVVRPGGMFVLEHSKARDYSSLPWFVERRVYGSVNFSIFRRPDDEA